ncbi:hypothetical protein L6452_29544 [Arctium lappa]|uniref:Uncharacterized protein n=1 Tax=Arctium lappa TaxID=4217 RepID=A0ACB8ZHW6_ARCLA|nr:hypothetical protein L6452_29544 [Arctium lappa]
MASPHTQSNPATSPPPPSFSSTDFRRHGRAKAGKAQMCLFKILRIISLFPVVDVSYKPKQRLSHGDGSCGNKEFDVDRNIGLGVSKEIEPLEHPPVATSGADCEDCVFMKVDRRKIDLFFEEKQETVEEEEERATEHSEISHVEDQSSGIDCNGFSEEVGEKLRDEGYLDLLIEAAQLILGDECNETEPARNKYVESSTAAENGGGTKRKKYCWTATATAEEAEWYAEFEDTSPVVKSKRGRNQVLPFKYRDSVLEPLVRRSPPRHRSNTGGALPSKRRSKS